MRSRLNRACGGLIRLGFCCFQTLFFFILCIYVWQQWAKAIYEHLAQMAGHININILKPLHEPLSVLSRIQVTQVARSCPRI